MAYSQSYRRMLHKMGYYDYQQGLIYHHLNQQKGWLAHEKHCRDFILKAAGMYHPEKITVLGSGWLLELPLAELAETTQHICLIDIIHPPAVKEQVKKLENIELLEMDVSGGLIENVWRKTANHIFFNRLKSIKDIEVPEFSLDDPGMVISLNILTQIEHLPVRMLEKKTKTGKDEILGFRKKIQNSHISFLMRHKSLLITETAELFTDDSGNTDELKTVIADLPDGQMKETWTWDFDLKGSDFKRKRSLMAITALML